jgi:microsomal dipeptidase-like Zn-dependent dipeptidase
VHQAGSGRRNGPRTARRCVSVPGLSTYGTRLVEAAVTHGISLDVSHASQRTSLDIVDKARSPVIASHANARAVCDSPRNLKDDVIKLLQHPRPPWTWLTGLSWLQDTPNIGPALRKAGFSDEEISGIRGGNFLRVFSKTWHG